MVTYPIKPLLTTWGCSTIFSEWAVIQKRRQSAASPEERVAKRNHSKKGPEVPNILGVAGPEDECCRRGTQSSTHDGDRLKGKQNFDGPCFNHTDAEKMIPNMQRVGLNQGRIEVPKRSAIWRTGNSLHSARSCSLPSKSSV
ncbi:hypothetical protein RvY_10854 [Ramazzottius varieornatus]|uniref:Uncharacterized protein n=1 Tax=Ramazzottius varieornatus TaxID=947166 RepID=A0A1D1VE50_RAMVA|nr:hypothetical protein RvY_10854 [Ramazzottius varieornatus]